MPSPAVTPKPSQPPLDAVIVGAGFAGLYMLHRLVFGFIPLALLGGRRSLRHGSAHGGQGALQLRRSKISVLKTDPQPTLRVMAMSAR